MISRILNVFFKTLVNKTVYQGFIPLYMIMICMNFSNSIPYLLMIIFYHSIFVFTHETINFVTDLKAIGALKKTDLELPLNVEIECIDYITISALGKIIGINISKPLSKKYLKDNRDIYGYDPKKFYKSINNTPEMLEILKNMTIKELEDLSSICLQEHYLIENNIIRKIINEKQN